MSSAPTLCKATTSSSTRRKTDVPFRVADVLGPEALPGDVEVMALNDWRPREGGGVERMALTFKISVYEKFNS